MNDRCSRNPTGAPQADLFLNRTSVYDRYPPFRTFYGGCQAFDFAHYVASKSSVTFDVSGRDWQART
jgi:hypothetical protein